MWLIRESILLDGIENNLKAELFKSQLFYKASLAGVALTNEVSVTYFNSAIRHYVQLGRLLLPYLKWPDLPDDKISEETVQTIRSEWEQTFGSLSDPVVRQEMAGFRKVADWYARNPDRRNKVTEGKWD